MRMDVHGHFFSRAYLERAVEFVTARPERDPFWRRHLQTRLLPDPTMWSLKGRLEKMDEEGVDVQSLSMVGPIEMARISNDAIAEACHQHPDRFGGLCCLPLTAGTDTSLAELRWCVEDLDMWGMTVGANVTGRSLDDAGLRGAKPASSSGSHPSHGPGGGRNARGFLSHLGCRVHV